MLRLMVIVHIFSLFIFLACCSKQPAEKVSKENGSATMVEKNVVAANNQFGFHLFQHLVSDDKDQNIFISPFSISLALTMTLNGADSKTRSAMQQTLEYQKLSLEQINQADKVLLDNLQHLDSKIQLQIANSIWYRAGFDVAKKFIELNRDYFQAQVTGLDFMRPGAVDEINDWVAQSTGNKITRIVSSINPLDVMFLINAIYFKGSWTTAFKEQNTHLADFTLLNNLKTKCRMMSRTADFYYFENEQFQIIKLPYGDQQVAMIVLLPQAGKNLDSLIFSLDQTKWNQLMQQLTKQKGTINLPKFKLEYEKSLKDVLAKMGMEIAFTDGADFSKITTKEDLLISEVKHKSYIDVNEEGTEAAAATSVRMALASARPGFNMSVDRPFIFAIWDCSKGTILFLGKIVEPKGA